MRRVRLVPSYIFASLCLMMVLPVVQALSAQVVVKTYEDVARAYLDADLVIIGHIVLYQKRVVSTKDTLGSCGIHYHDTTFLNTHTIQVDSVLKGSFIDSVIMFKEETVQYDYFKKSAPKFDGVDERGDSLFISTITLLNSAETLTEIPKQGRYYLFLALTESGYRCLLSWPYEEGILHLFRQVEKEGERYFTRSKARK